MTCFDNFLSCGPLYNLPSNVIPKNTNIQNSIFVPNYDDCDRLPSVGCNSFPNLKQFIFFFGKRRKHVSIKITYNRIEYKMVLSEMKPHGESQVVLMIDVQKKIGHAGKHGCVAQMIEWLLLN